MTLRWFGHPLALATVILFVSSCYDTDTKSAAASIEVTVPAGKFEEVEQISQSFAKEHGLTFASTKREQKFGASQTLELESADILILVSNPFSTEDYVVSSYAKSGDKDWLAEERAKGLAREISNVGNN